MIALVRGIVGAFVLFAAFFALHIVGGATDQGWLFAIAVGLIFISATGYPAIALWLSGLDRRAGTGRALLLAGGIIGTGFTLGALWAANDRSFAAWEFPLAPALVVAVSSALLFASRILPGTRLSRAATS